jgi:hypothetical protein
MKIEKEVVAFAVVTMLFALPAVVQAQGQAQTAAGAQKFLASVADGNAVRAYVSGNVPVVLTTTYSDNRAPEIKNTEAIYAWSAAAIGPGEGLCQTQATSTEVNTRIYDLFEPNFDRVNDATGTWTAQKPGPVILSVRIDWGKATIRRGGWTRFSFGYKQAIFSQEKSAITVMADGYASLEYSAEDPEMLDRIEYAMKFLKASCDRTVDTGF